MVNIIHSSLALLLVFVTFSPGSVSPVRIDINPNSKKITCVADKLAPLARTITSIELNRPNGLVIVRLDQSLKVTVDKDPQLFIKETEGKIEKNVEKSHLTVTMSDILISQSGMYSCTVYYKNMKGNDQHQSAKNLLNVTSQDTPRSWDTVRYQLWTLKRDVKDLDKVSSRVDKLEDWKDEQNKRMITMKQQADYMSAFSAGYDYDTDRLENDKVIVFREVHMKVGNGYDETSGIFTAPVDGYYVFHLTMFHMDPKQGDLGINLIANNEDVAQAYVDDTLTRIQATVNTFVKLKTGQEVKPVVKYITNPETNQLNVNSDRSVFTGYLIKAL